MFIPNRYQKVVVTTMDLMYNIRIENEKVREIYVFNN